MEADISEESIWWAGACNSAVQLTLQEPTSDSCGMVQNRVTIMRARDKSGIVALSHLSCVV